MFPKEVCILQFYNFSNENESLEASKFKEAFEENITYVKIDELDTSLDINMDNFENICELTSENVSLPAVFVGNASFHMDDRNISRAVEEGKKFELIGLQCPKHKGICIVFFYNPSCHECTEAKDELESMNSRYPLNIEEYSTLSTEGIDLLFKYYDAFNVSDEEMGSFAIFIGDKYYYKVYQFDELEQEIKKYVNTGLPCPRPSEEGSAEKTLKGFTILTVMAGGLVDGINPVHLPP